MADTTKLFNDTIDLIGKIIIPKRYKHVSLYENSPEYDKLKRLTHLILNAERKENSIPLLKTFDNIILPFKDIKFDYSKSNNSVYMYCMYDAIDELDNSKKVFKFINASIHLKLIEKYYSRTITCIILDVMIYCIINNIEINLMDLINVDLQLKDKPEDKWTETKNNFTEAMPDGYMKDVILKAIEQEDMVRKIPHTYSIVDIVNQLKKVFTESSKLN